MNVQVYDAAHRQLRTRAVPPPRSAERLGASTVAETTALIIRGELSAALSAMAESPPTPPETVPPTTEVAATPSNGATPGSSLGTEGLSRGTTGSSTSAPSSQSKPKDAPPAPAPADPQEPSEPEPPEADDETEPGLSGTLARPDRLLALAVGARLSAPGAGLALGGLWLGARLELRGFELTLGASSTLPAQRENDAVRLTLRRHAIAADLLALVLFGYDLELWLGVSGGIVLHARQTRALDALHETTPDHTTFGAVFAPLAELRWRFTYNVGVSLRIGLDLLPSAPRFTYEPAAGQRAELAKLAALEPFVLVSLFASTWR